MEILCSIRLWHAAFMAWKLTVISAMIISTDPARTSFHQWISIL
ncbi:MAG TPA: hypothetical protein VGN00_04680 [Puia sp.]|jgi:hypothetical protein